MGIVDQMWSASMRRVLPFLCAVTDQVYPRLLRPLYSGRAPPQRELCA